jgi:hypothetical protein
VRLAQHTPRLFFALSHLPTGLFGAGSQLRTPGRKLRVHVVSTLHDFGMWHAASFPSGHEVMGRQMLVAAALDRLATPYLEFLDELTWKF